MRRRRRVGRRAPLLFSQVHFAPDYIVPLWERMLSGLRSVKRGKLPRFFLLAEQHVDLNDVDNAPKNLPVEFVHTVEHLDEKRKASLFGSDALCLAPHWYDGLTLFLKAFRPWWTVDLASSKPIAGTSASLATCVNYVRRIVSQGPAMPHGGVPVLVGETGIPFDLGGGMGDLETVTLLALDRTMSSLERSLACFTLWNYTHTGTTAQGDGWNGEDLSVFTEEARGLTGTAADENIYAGGRALAALIRPHARKVAGTPVSMRFDAAHPRRTFDFCFRHTAATREPTEIFVPQYQYPDGYSVKISDGEWRHDAKLQTLYVAAGTWTSAAQRVGPP